MMFGYLFGVFLLCSRLFSGGTLRRFCFHDYTLKQDHHAVIGLDKLSFKATDAQIKKAYKCEVLHYHPDKRRARGLEVKDGVDDYFTCITRAWETLGNPVKRKSYDSVDPLFDDSVPPSNNNSKEKFYDVFGPVFAENARWSNKKCVPDIGDESSSFEEVNRFYGFCPFDSYGHFRAAPERGEDTGKPGIYISLLISKTEADLD